MTIETVSFVTWAHCPTRSHTITSICSVQLVAGSAFHRGKPVRAFQDVRPAAVGTVAVHEPGWCARGGAVVLDVAQLAALLTRTFSIGLDVGRGREKVALVRLRLSRALLGAAETQAMAAGAPAIEQGGQTK